MPGPDSISFNEEERHILLSLAEWSISDFIISGKRNPRPDYFPVKGKLHTPLGVFVSVYIEKELRGCIGSFSESQPLIDNIQQMSIQAATEDRRFKPVKSEELMKMELEISVLLPRVRIKGPEDVKIGKHGIYMIHGHRRATLLPQVAVNNNWDAITFLECCASNKLGLNKNSWLEAELYVYEALVIR
jgi:AmmeMemoRadiSam system protein A